VKTIAKHALRWALVFLDANRFDLIQPSTDMIGPAKRNGDDRYKFPEAFSIFHIDIFKIEAS
ncbi:hypothetical protein C2W62_54495, partial [Candidatus Entotheonella serta]